MEDGKDKTYGMAPERDQDIWQDSLKAAAGTKQKRDEYCVTYRSSMESVNTGTAVAGMELQVSGFAAGTAADLFKGEIFKGIADELIVRELQGCNRVEQGFQYVHGFSLARMQKEHSPFLWLRRVDGSRSRFKLW